MKWIVDIDEKDIKALDNYAIFNTFDGRIMSAVLNGTPLDEPMYYPQIEGITPTVVQDLPMGDKTAKGLSTFERKIR